jgi:hypothetical protein
LLAGPTLAQAPEPSLAEKETARALFEEGDAKYQAGDYAGALEDFVAADAIMHVPTTGLELGRTQAALGMLLEARDTLVRVTLIPKQPDDNEYFVQARAEAAALADQIAKRIPSLEVRATGLADGVEPQLLVDGTRIAAALARHALRLNPGKRVVEIRAEGYAPARREVVLAEREQRVLEVAITRASAPASPDGPATAEPDGRFSPIIWVGFGVGAAGLVVAAITGGMAIAAEDDLAGRCPDKVCPPGDEGDLERAKALGNAATASSIIGGVGVLVGLTALVIDLAWQREQAPAVEPAGLGLRARF